MFGIGVPELVLILIIGLIVFGPGKLPEMGRTLGKGIREFRKASNALSQAINAPEQPAQPQAPPTQPATQAPAAPVQPAAPGSTTVQSAAPAPAQPAASAPAQQSAATGAQSAGQTSQQPPVYQAPTQESVRQQLAATQGEAEQKKD